MFLENFSCVEDVISEFEITEADLEGYDVLFAWYGDGDFDGAAFVLIRDKDYGTLYEVNGSHCSCFGLEGQWEPELVTVEQLRYRIIEGRLGRDSYSDGGMFADDLLKVLEGLDGA